MDFPVNIGDNDNVPARQAGSSHRFDREFMINTPGSVLPAGGSPEPDESEQQRFERILSRPQFRPLRAVFDNLGVDVPAMRAAIIGTYCYQNFLSELGYRVNVVPQIHESDCYTRLGRQGGIRAVLPVHDTTNYSTLVTLVNFDSTVVTTANSVEFYDEQLREFKIQLMNRSGDAK